MPFPKVLNITNWQKTLKIGAVVILVAILGYVAGRVWKISPEILRQMPAAFQPKEEEKILAPEEKLKIEEISLPQPQQVLQKRETYLEKAEKGEGLTHLARRALREYLKENPQEFELTKEHKIYIEDYLAKALGYRWLQLGEEVEFKSELIKEAINKAQQLTPTQLENLSQFVELVPGI